MRDDGEEEGGGEGAVSAAPFDRIGVDDDKEEEGTMRRRVRIVRTGGSHPPLVSS